MFIDPASNFVFVSARGDITMSLRAELFWMGRIGAINIALLTEL